MPLVDLLRAATPSPGPTPPPDDLVTPGPLGFLIPLAVAVLAILLILDMVRRVRRTQARERARERIAAELATSPEVGETEPEDPRSGR
ncbi:MAG: hypothetical protein HY996_07855 [Micrococcales bacterium]|nr:hypothetical protein [Micrococcales bacterium]